MKDAKTKLSIEGFAQSMGLCRRRRLAVTMDVQSVLRGEDSVEDTMSSPEVSCAPYSTSKAKLYLT